MQLETTRRSRNIDRIHEATVSPRVSAGVSMRGFTGETHLPATFLEARLELGARFVHEVPGEHIVFIYVLEGELSIGPSAKRVHEAQIAWFDAGAVGPSVIEVFAAAESHLIAFSTHS